MEVSEDVATSQWRSDTKQLAIDIADRLARHDDQGAVRGALLLVRLLVAGYMAEWVDVKYHKMTEQEARNAGQVLAEHLTSFLQ